MVGKNKESKVQADGETYNVTVLRKRKTIEEKRARALHNRKTHDERRKPMKKKTQILWHNPNDVVKNYRQTQRQLRTLGRLKRGIGKPMVKTPSKTKVALVVRKKSDWNTPREVRTFLETIGLKAENQGVLTVMTKVTADKLAKIGPYVFVGYPNEQQVHELVFTRAHATQKKGNMVLSDNMIVEEALGEFGLLCLADLVHELITCGDHVQEVIRFLSTFKFTLPGDKKHAAKTLKKMDVFKDKRHNIVGWLLSCLEKA